MGGNCTIKNLKTAGTISSSNMYATGLIAGIKDGSTVTVENCHSSVALKCTGSGDMTNSGFVGRLSSVNLTIRGCAFDGSFEGGSTTNTGFVAWIAPACTVTIKDCLFAPASINTSTGTCATFTRKNANASAPTITNCYYTRAYGTAQGTQVISTTGTPSSPGSLTTDYGMVKAYESGLYFNGKYYIAPAISAGTGTEGDPYIISNASEWDTFASYVSNGDNNYSGKFVQLTADISVSTTVGSSETNSFKGTFIGGSHTITATITDNSSQGTALFRYINGATIEDLNVTGTITSDKYHAAALVGFLYGTCNIQNCSVTANVNGSGYVGGIVGHASSSDISISGCAFSGLMTGGGNYTGAFIGWGDSGTRTVTDCLYVMQKEQSTSNFDIVREGGTLSVSNCYKTTSAGSYGKQTITTDAEPANLGALSTDYGTVKAYENGIFYSGMYYTTPTLSGSGTEESPYTISNEFEWESFVCLVNSGTNYSGKYVKLTDDISVTTSAGATETNSFQGTFDGNGYTITATIEDNDNQGTALFRHIDGATIKNLTVGGTITSDEWHAAALVGSSKGTCFIDTCMVTATVKGSGYVGGIVGHAGSSNISVRACVFSGLMTGGNTCTRVFIGWGDSGTRTVTDCLYVMHNEQSTTNFDLVKDGGTLSVSNCYYIASNNLSTTQGKRAYTITTDGEFSMESGSAVISSGNGLTFYDTGFMYDDLLYAASGDHVLLTFSSDREGYNSPTYEPSAGTISGTENPYTLTMPAEAVTISMDWGLSGLSGKGTEASPYLISSVDNWNTFVDYINSGNVAGFKDEYVKLTADISVTTMAGSDGNHTFRGTFDGDGHTLTVNYDTSEEFAAPFRYTFGCTIKNLKTSGTITTSSTHAGGVVGRNGTSNITLTNVVSDVAIASSYSGDEQAGFHGGLMGYTINATFTGCAFTGTLTGTKTHHWGGLLGQKSATENTTVSFVDCLFDPTSVNIHTGMSYPFAYGPSAYISVSNSYYTNKLLYEQGTEAYATTTQPTILGSLTTDYGLVKAYSNGLYSNGKYYVFLAKLEGSGTEAAPYLISSTDDWNTFVSNVNNGNRFNGQYVKLTADIAVTTKVGTVSGSTLVNPFSGIFDGDGHTITATITDNSNQGAAIFCYINGATIKNLKVASNITSDKYHAAGLVGIAKETNNSIENCVVTGTINGSEYVGGIVAHAVDGDISISGCVFSGLMTGGSKFQGSIIGWGDSGSRTVTNCLYLMADGQNTYNFDLVKESGTLTVTNYYKTTGAGSYGKQPRTIKAGENVTIDAITPMGNSTATYSVSGITAYEMGIIHNETFYYGSDDQVSLTLSGLAPISSQPGYNNEGYSTSAGILTGTENPYTLTMPNVDVTIHVGLPIDWATVNAGTAEDPYMIYNTGQLDLLAQRVNTGTSTYSGKYFKLANDITYSHTTKWDNAESNENNFTPIGSYYYDEDEDEEYNYYFCGDFDGNGHTVSGIRVYKGNSGEEDFNQGLFGQTGYGANIHGVTLADTRITGYDNTAGIVGYNYGSTISGCHVAATVTIHAAVDYAYEHGGIVGYNKQGTISHCTSAATLTSDDNYYYEDYGAICGYIYGTLSDNLAISATIPYADCYSYGAICGYNDGTLLRNYYTACNVAGTANATNVGSGCAITDEYDDYDYQSVDITENDGAVPALRDDTDNTTAIGLMRTLPNSIAEQKATYPVAIYGRTLYKDGNWNSICLPFSLDDFDGTIFEDATVMTLGNSEACKTNFDATSGTLNLEFLPDNKIEAGVAYIVKWDKADDYKGNESTYDITDPVFCGVTIENENPNNHGIVSKDNKVTFVGNYNPVSIADEDKSLLFLGANNTLYYPNAAMTIGAFHAYFQLDGITAGDPDAGIKAFNLNFGNGDNATGIITFTSATEDDGSWYTLSGVKLNAKPTQRGIYLNNGHKVMIK